MVRLTTHASATLRPAGQRGSLGRTWPCFLTASHGHVLVLEEDAIFSETATWHGRRWTCMRSRIYSSCKARIRQSSGTTVVCTVEQCLEIARVVDPRPSAHSRPAHGNVEGHQQEVAIRISRDHEHRDCPHECLCELRHQCVLFNMAATFARAIRTSPRTSPRHAVTRLRWLAQPVAGPPHRKGIDRVWQIYPQVLVVPPMVSQELKTALFEHDMRIFESSCVL